MPPAQRGKPKAPRAGGQTGSRRVGRFTAPRFKPVGFPAYPRGPLQTTSTAPQTFTPPDPPPDWGRASTPEWWVYWYLTRVKKLSEEAGDFVYQSSQDGGRLPGGQVVDFVIYTPMAVAILVNGRHWHLGTQRKIAVGEQQRIQAMRAVGAAVIVWDDDLEQRLFYTMESALAGVQLSRPGEDRR